MLLKVSVRSAGGEF